MKTYYLDIIDIDKYQYNDLFSHFNTPYITKYLMPLCIIHKYQFRFFASHSEPPVPIYRTKLILVLLLIDLVFTQK